jgi:hypothetical protein
MAFLLHEETRVLRPVRLSKLRPSNARSANRRSEATHVEVTIPAENAILSGTLTLPEDARGLVLFAHGNGSSRHCPRNRFVARELNDAGLGTLLFDLLTRLKRSTWWPGRSPDPANVTRPRDSLPFRFWSRLICHPWCLDELFLARNNLIGL